MGCLRSYTCTLRHCRGISTITVILVTPPLVVVHTSNKTYLAVHARAGEDPRSQCALLGARVAVLSTELSARDRIVSNATAIVRRQ